MRRSTESPFSLLYYRLAKLSLIHLSVNQTLCVLVLLVTLFTTAGKQIGAFGFLELAVFDRLTRTLPQKKSQEDLAQSKIVVVEITEQDLLKQGEWPFSDLTLAKALRELQEHQPRMIGVDLYRNLPQGEGIEDLEREFAKDNVMAIYDVGGRVDAPPSIPENRQGFNDLVLDPDGVVRRHLLYTYTGEREFYSFSLLLALGYLGQDNLSVGRSPDGLTIADTKFSALRNNSGAYQNLDAAGYQILLNQPPNMNIDRLPFSLVVEGAAPPELIRDRVVLIGSTAPSLKDTFRTPIHKGNRINPLFSGVELHAQQVNQILNISLGEVKPFYFWTEWQEILWIIGWSAVGAVAIRTAKNLRSLILIELAAGGLLILVTELLFQQYIWIPMISPLFGLGLCSVLVLAHKLIDTSFVDPLTHLPNRQQFFLHLRFAIKHSNQSRQSRFAVLFLGIDRFNIINDSFGYAVGDKILTGLAQRIKTVLNDIETTPLLARVGGDEFAILLPHMQNSDEIQVQADQLQAIVQKPFLIEGKELILSCCIGIALGQPSETYEPEQLLRNAHTAMYRAKMLGRSSYEVFAAGMKNQMTERLKMETDLRYALTRDEMELYYQPLIDLKQGTLIGFEALIRWNHPSGIISPYNFIPVAEETGFIIPLGKWIIQTACRQMQTWHELFPEHSNLGLSINLSGRQFSHPDLVQDIRSTLDETQLSSDCLKMEVTESIAMQNVEKSIDLLLELKELGLQLSIDDFGTGYSSLSYLCQFPIDTLKVDRSFVVQMQESDADYAIVQTIVTLSHALGMTIVAEGIETAEQRDILKGLDCEFGQGYLFAKPLRVFEAEALIESNQAFF
ncbi:periplasmic sensor diguanylate cyclase/phosphodiesterase [[Leptolyngbya] sp. PCC 7376]|uniref:EAL domain-containing protein n=1 Tax=[Leptolyngbya] sp. PCC 7376 TaxID=111781 RepID=UPI00029EDE48|nr:EAL domain-containing protein [[Leptolyngbya] sp. PCC 7376]AFY39731.1 periplasmic sensor diguanylate cyclase/phosphodiesterase [[Leptolyngbya] sp. PCC 7376]